MVELFQAMMRFNTILVDFDRDIRATSHSVTSSKKLSLDKLAHQITAQSQSYRLREPEGNLGLANAVLAHLAEKLPVSRWQRDLTDSTVLRNMGVGFGYSLLAYTSTLKGISKLEVNAAKLAEDLVNS